MLKAGLIGIGAMGRGHLDVYIELARQGFPVTLTAICDIDEKKFQNQFVPGNMNVGLGTYDFSPYHLYTQIDEMLACEQLDYVDIALPTYLHETATIKALRRGLHVLCEKPMALNVDACQRMIDAAQAAGRHLMIGQCLRFWPQYEELKAAVEDRRFGAVTGAYFYRGGGTPQWSYENWLQREETSGGCLLDQHIHDVDMIHWLFGMPQAVSTLGKKVIEGSGYDVVSTNYRYPGMVVNAQDDWTINGQIPFGMLYRVNFERGAMLFERGELTIAPVDAPAYKYVNLAGEDGYTREIRAFVRAVIEDRTVETATPESTRDTIAIAQAEKASADSGGEWVTVGGV